MPAYAPAAQLDELAANPAIDAFRPKRPTVLSYGLGAVPERRAEPTWVAVGRWIAQDTK
ncbi:hypothetical protein [Streptomyces sp. NPDC003710]